MRVKHTLALLDKNRSGMVIFLCNQTVVNIIVTFFLSISILQEGITPESDTLTEQVLWDCSYT